jgi:hypothetical protein
MSSATVTAEPKAGVDYNPQRLFLGSCFSLIATAITFAVVGDIMGKLKGQFLLTNTDVGLIGGAATWGFTVSIFILGPLCDILGMRLLMWFAFLCHAVGVIVMIIADHFASGSGGSAFWALFFGALIIALGNGTVEAVCNPLIATIYPDKKTKMLARFHMWFPGGIVIGGLICYAINQAFPAGLVGSMGSWQVKLIAILLPTLIYGVLFIGQKFPHTERVQSGVTFGGMFKEAFTRPMFLILLVCMMVTSSLELGPNRWVPSVLEAGGIPGILVLCYISGLMAILRFFAGPVVHKFSNTGVLLVSAILGGAGLLGLSFSTSIGTALAAATVFAVGVCYFWPTMLGTVAERVPKSGSLGLALMGGMGMLIVGVVTTPGMGDIADRYLFKELKERQTETVAALTAIKDTYPAWEEASTNKVTKSEIADAAKDAGKALDKFTATKELPEESISALRAAMKVAPNGDAKEVKENALRLTPAVDAGKKASGLINEADNHGGLKAFQFVAPFSLFLVLVFGILYFKDRAAGGYKVERLTKDSAH